MLYDLVACPHRVAMDVFGDPGERDEPNPFIQLLWERGALYEREVIDGLDIPFLDLSTFAGEEKERNVQSTEMTPDNACIVSQKMRRRSPGAD